MAFFDGGDKDKDKKEFIRLQKELDDLLAKINRELLIENSPSNVEEDDEEEKKAETEFVTSLITANALLTKAAREKRSSSASTTGQRQTEQEDGEFDIDGLQKMLDTIEVHNTLKELQRNLTDFSTQIKDGDPDLKLLNTCLEAGIKALKAPEDVQLAANFSKAALELYEKKKDAPKWRKITSSLLQASAISSGLAVFVGASMAVGAKLGVGAGIAMGTAVLGSLTLGGAVAVVAAALVIFLIARKMQSYKNATQEEATKLKENSNKIQEYSNAENTVTKKLKT